MLVDLQSFMVVSVLATQVSHFLTEENRKEVKNKCLKKLEF